MWLSDNLVGKGSDCGIGGRGIVGRVVVGGGKLWRGWL